MFMRVIACGAAGLAAVSGVASAQPYPSKPVRVVTSAAGGGNDVVARMLTPFLATGLGQPVIVDNRGGGVVPGEIVSKSPPDGYSVLYASASFWIGSLLRDTPYDPVRDFAPVSLVASSPNILVVHPSLPARSVKDLIGLAKARPGELNYASGNPGASNHLAAELFKSMAGVSMVGIPYKGTGPAFSDLIGGQVQLMFPTAGSVMPHVKSGRLRALGVTSAQTTTLAPGLPTVASSGLPGYESVSLDAAFVPANTPSAVVNRLNQEFLRVLARAELKERFLSVGVEPVGSSPEGLAAAVKAEMVKLGKVIKDAGIRAE